jgi:hypothetical protein
MLRHYFTAVLSWLSLAVPAVCPSVSTVHADFTAFAIVHGVQAEPAHASPAVRMKSDPIWTKANIAG